MIGIRYIIDGQALPSLKEFKRLNADKIRSQYRKLKTNRAIIESIPDWMDKLGMEELQDKWPPTLHALNRKAEVILRTNLLKTNPAELGKLLQREGIRTELVADAALRVTKRKSLFRTEAFKKGYFEVQDFSSQQVAPFCEVGPGMRVVDACSGAGGKALHLAVLMENKGQLISLDTAAWKLNEQRKRARRNGIHIIETRPIENTKTIKRLRDSADRLLLDVPCSGLGVLRRNPDSKWKLTPDFVANIRETQQEIIQSYSRILRKDGKLIYATCSVLPSENQQQVEKFLASEPGKAFELEEQKSILPQEEGFDGFFMARLRKK